MTLPTPYELATLAAAIPIKRAFKYDGGMPNETFKDELSYRAHHAYDLWRICEQVIDDAPIMVELMAEKKAAIREADFSKIPLDELLNKLMRGKPEDKLRWWRDYRAAFFGGDRQVTKDRTEGIERAGVKTVMEHFRAWKTKEQRKIKREATSKGGKATSAQKKAKAEQAKINKAVSELESAQKKQRPLSKAKQFAEDVKIARQIDEAKANHRQANLED